MSDLLSRAFWKAALVLADVLDGKITREAARATYGVALTVEGDAVDAVATKHVRVGGRAAARPD